MEPFTLLIATIAAVIAVSVVTWETVQSWIEAKKIARGSASIVRERLASGRYRVVAGVFTSSGALADSKTWEGDKLDAELTARLEREGGRIVVRT